MRITTKTKNLEFSESLATFVDGKFIALKKFTDILKEEDPERGRSLAEVLVEVERETKHHRKGEIFLVKVQLNLPGKVLMAESRADSLQAAVVGARDNLKMEIEKYKFKKIDKPRRLQRKSQGMI